MSTATINTRGNEEARRAAAAVRIQRHYRGHRERRELKGHGLTANQRWNSALRDAHYRQVTAPVSREERKSSTGGSPSRELWTRAVSVACAAQHDDEESENDCGEEDERRKEIRRKRKERQEFSKAMDMQYFLEMVDTEHRYGSNLRAYHEYWKQEDTHENFFYWLDKGAGREVDLSICSRDRLEAEKVRYLSREERQDYLVKIDSEGRLCWAKNGERIDTTEKYTDSKHGIVPVDAAAGEPAVHGHNRTPRPTTASSSSSSSSTSVSSTTDSEASVRANIYTGHHSPLHRRRRRDKFHVSPATILNRLLRKTIKKNTWIFVADISFRLYVGIKQSGAFQHSSFLHGARVSAAGLIKIKDGKLKSLSPLSGHYRPSASHFRRFVRSLKEAGVDMSGMSISKSYAVLVGLEGWSKMKQGKKKARRNAEDAVEKVQHPETIVEGKPGTGGVTAAQPKLAAAVFQEVRRKKVEDVDMRERKHKHEEGGGGAGAGLASKFMQRLRLRPQHKGETETKGGDNTDPLLPPPPQPNCNVT